MAGTVEHVLNTRYAGARRGEQAEAKPRGVAPTVTSDSLLAELAAARQSAPREPRAADPAPPRKSSSGLLRAFLFIGFA
ncbi:MAG TPA: hypothetical protein VJO12_16910, partial [Stellaceae bacterium]|nr:hypothetical protein [Stellaceae bacterium]